MPPLARTLLRGAALLAIWALATATSWIAPNRPLSDDEKLALTVSQSDAIVIAQFLQLRDSTFNVPSPVEGAPPSERLLFPYKDVTLRPIRWLKGFQEGANLHIGMHEMIDVALGDLVRARGEEFVGVFFLRRAVDCWMIQDYPLGYKKGHIVRLDGPAAETDETRAIEAMVARQSLDSLLLRADLVVLGHRVSHGRVRVDSVLVGCAPSDTLGVDSPMPGVVDNGRVVYFLGRVSAGQYEPLDFHAGAGPVQADTLARQGLPLRQVFQRAAELRPRQEGRGGARP